MKMLGFLLLVAFVHSAVYIDDFGAIANQDTVDAQIANSLALSKAIQHVNNSDDCTVVVPNRKYYFFPVHVQHVNNLNLKILGKVIASKNVRNWPHTTNGKRIDYLAFLKFDYCDNLTISGGGKVDGRGYHWWMLTLLV